ncbi:MAG: GNAT family N-acetyltransferase [Rhodocyclaceae bacterium]|nr:GNAT family N-acetyltransferase [Rhodocyclaceae bacterium]
MRNADVIELFDRVPVYTPVSIVEFAVEDGSWSDLQSAARAVRETVFVQEQQVPADLEWDEFDVVCRHAIARNAEGQAIGTGRLLPDGRIGRMAVLPGWRGKEVGSALFERLLQAAKFSGMPKIELHAQTHAAGFYAHYGCIAQGREYMEAGIPHISMTRML